MFVPERSQVGRTAVRVAGKGSRVIVSLAVTVAVAGVVLAILGALLFDQAKAFFTAGEAGSDVATIELAPLAQRSLLYAADGTLLQYLHGEEDRVPVTLDRVPKHVITAVLDAEDERYYEHGAIDLRSMTRALVSNLEAGGISEGGSTITQQLVKTALLNPKQDVNRKLQEASLAIRLERQMSKDEILERYLNTVYFGNSAYGLQAAAERYYQTDVDKLTLGQAILLAGLIRNPVYADPLQQPRGCPGPARRHHRPHGPAQPHHPRAGRSSSRPSHCRRPYRRRISTARTTSPATSSTCSRRTRSTWAEPKPSATA